MQKGQHQKNDLLQRKLTWLKKKEAKEQTRGNPQAAKHNYLCREVGRRAKKDRELYIQGSCKEVKESRLHNKTHLVDEAIRWITARYAPQIRVIKDGQGHLLTEPEEVKQSWRQYLTPYTMTLMLST